MGLRGAVCGVHVFGCNMGRVRVARRLSGILGAPGGRVGAVVGGRFRVGDKSWARISAVLGRVENSLR